MSQWAVPPVPPEIPRTGNPLSAWLGRVVLRLLGWRFTGRIPAAPKLVIIIAPHTSAWDFVVALAGKWALRLDTAYLAKDSLFRWPLSVLLERTGGLPVDRTRPHDLVDRMKSRFAERERLILSLAPEGTRRRVERWRTGFYRIAEAAGVPILPIALDFGRRAIAIGEPLRPSGDQEADTRLLRAFFADVRGARER